MAILTGRPGAFSPGRAFGRKLCQYVFDRAEIYDKMGYAPAALANNEQFIEICWQNANSVAQ